MITKTKIIVRYAETDQMGIAHHSNYAVWFEAGRTDLIKSMGMTYSDMENNGVIVPLTSLECHYKKAAYYEDELVVESRLTKATNTKLEFEYQILRMSTNDIISTGKTVHGMVSHNLQPIRMKKEKPEIFAMLKSAIEPSIF
ncbi:MAG: thioesterase family protein [Lachnospiraceae bacterium]|nr:thioesterase family protein [Lachnospiraceae bacterium]